MTDTSKKIEFRAPPKVRDLLKSHAARRQKESGKTVYPSDLLREALEQWLEREGTPYAVDVDRGGNRKVV